MTIKVRTVTETMPPPEAPAISTACSTPATNARAPSSSPRPATRRTPAGHHPLSRLLRSGHRRSPGVFRRPGLLPLSPPVACPTGLPSSAPANDTSSVADFTCALEKSLDWISVVMAASGCDPPQPASNASSAAIVTSLVDVRINPPRSSFAGPREHGRLRLVAMRRLGWPGTSVSSCMH